MRAPSIDYDAVRRALVFAVRLATGLESTQVISTQPEEAVAPAPVLPYITLGITEVDRAGRDWHEVVATADNMTTFATTGPRVLMVSANAFAATHEQTMGLINTWQAALGSMETRELLAGAGLTVQDPGQVRDLSEKYDTAWQPRAYLQSQFGVMSWLLEGYDTIDHVQAESMIVPPQTGTDVQSAAGGATAEVLVSPTDAVGMLVCITGDAQMTAADATLSSRMPAVGMIIDKDDAHHAIVQVTGITPVGALTGLSVSQVYYVGVDGQPTTAPLMNLTYVQRVGVAISSTQLLLHISPTGIVRRIPPPTTP